MPEEAAVLELMWEGLADSDPRLADLLDGSPRWRKRLKRFLDAVLVQFAHTYVGGYVLLGC